MNHLNWMKQWNWLLIWLWLKWIERNRWSEDEFGSGADPLSRGNLALSDDGHRLPHAPRLALTGRGLHHRQAAPAHHLAQPQLHGPTPRIRARPTPTGHAHHHHARSGHAHQRRQRHHHRRRHSVRQSRQLVPPHPHAASALDRTILIRNGVQLPCLNPPPSTPSIVALFPYFSDLSVCCVLYGSRDPIPSLPPPLPLIRSIYKYFLIKKNKIDYSMELLFWSNPVESNNNNKKMESIAALQHCNIYKNKVVSV